MSTRVLMASAQRVDVQSRESFGACWFRAASVVFAVGVAAGLLFSAFGPVPFIRVLGSAGALAGALGMLVAFAGCRHFRRQERTSPLWTPPAAAPVSRPAPAPLACESGTTERLAVWPGVTQPV